MIIFFCCFFLCCSKDSVSRIPMTMSSPTWACDRDWIVWDIRSIGQHANAAAVRPVTLRPVSTINTSTMTFQVSDRRGTHLIAWATTSDRLVSRMVFSIICHRNFDSTYRRALVLAACDRHGRHPHSRILNQFTNNISRNITSRSRSSSNLRRKHRNRSPLNRLHRVAIDAMRQFRPKICQLIQCPVQIWINTDYATLPI